MKEEVEIRSESEKLKESSNYSRDDSNAELSIVAEPNGDRISSFKELWIWQQSRELVTVIYKMTNAFPSEEKYGLTSQLRRAAVSVPSNIAEGWARNKSGYLIQSLGYARGSIHEVETQLLVSVDLGFLKQNDVDPTLNSIAAISTGILRFINKLESK